MSIRFYLQTRGKTIDYCFLYEAPSSDWWRYYADYTLFEDKTIILERLIDGKGGLYLSGIPSSRRDRVNTIIRYTLVAEFDQDKGREIFPLVERFLLDDCCKSSNVLGDKLDEDDYFPERCIENALRNVEREGQKRQDKINQKIEILLKSFSISDSYDKHQKGAWWGGLKSEESCKNWLSLANQILNGEPGLVALLNATSEKSLPSLKERLHREDIENIFILLTDNDTLPTPIRDIPKPIEGFRKGGIIFGGFTDDFWPLQTKVYVGASVLVSAFLFLVFMLIR